MTTDDNIKDKMPVPLTLCLYNSLNWSNMSITLLSVLGLGRPTEVLDTRIGD